MDINFSEAQYWEYRNRELGSETNNKVPTKDPVVSNAGVEEVWVQAMDDHMTIIVSPQDLLDFIDEHLKMGLKVTHEQWILPI